MADRISSMDDGYVSGQLSLFPDALDDKSTLYVATNNSKVNLKQTLTYNGRRVIVETTDGFPENGIIRVGREGTGEYEMIYYAKKTKSTFEDLIRGFAGSRQNTWAANENTVANAVFAEHHNAIKDALLNMQVNGGVYEFPEETSLNGILKSQEVRFLAPKPQFRAYPVLGPAPMKVRFQNFSSGHVIKFLWDFGDGGTSLEKSPTHTYLKEGTYTVKLNVVTSQGAQGIATKTGYIRVNNDESIPFFYVDSINDPYSVKTASELNRSPKEFVFVDQSDGDIVQRNWIFGDGDTFSEQDPDIHQTTHIYQEPGEYVVSQLIQFANNRLKRVELPNVLIVL